MMKKTSKSSVRGAPTIVEFVTDAQLLNLSLSPCQTALLYTVYGLPLTGEYADLYRHCTGRTSLPIGPFSEVTVIAGARGGKDSRIAAPIVCYEAVFGGHEKYLTKGERAVIPLVAQDQRATRISAGYIFAYFRDSPLLQQFVADERAMELDLTNRVTIGCFPSTKAALRGWSNPVGVMNELAFFRFEGSAESDAEIQASIRRGMLSFPSTKLVKISTPYMRSGVLYDDLTRAWGQDDPDLLVWRASSQLMNPTVANERLERQRRLDPSRYAREYEAEFVDDLSAFVPVEWVDDAVVAGRRELPPRDGEQYVAAVDPSGGGADAFTLAVAHREGNETTGRVVLDVLKGRAKVGSTSPDLASVVEEYAGILKRYRVTEVVGDRYAGEFPRQAFASHGVRYRESARDKTKAYLELEPLLSQGRIDLLDHATLARELRLLERRPRAGGRDVIDHPRGSHDDHANAVALAATQAMSRSSYDWAATIAGFAAANDGLTLPRWRIE